MKSHFSINRVNVSPAFATFLLGLAVAAAGMWLLGAGTRGATAQATPSRIAVVDFQKILRESVPGKASIARMTAMQEDRLNRAKAMAEEARKLETDLKNTALTPAQRNATSQRLADKQLQMKRFAEDADKDIDTLRTRELQDLQSRIRPVIDSIGREMGMAAIFNKFESGMVYANDAIDVTNAVVTRFNSAAPAPAATPRR